MKVPGSHLLIYLLLYLIFSRSRIASTFLSKRGYGEFQRMFFIWESCLKQSPSKWKWDILVKRCHESQSLRPGTLLKKETLTQVFSFEFCENFKKKLFYRTLPVAASHELLMFFLIFIALLIPWIWPDMLPIIKRFFLFFSWMKVLDSHLLMSYWFFSFGETCGIRWWRIVFIKNCCICVMLQ